MRTMGHVAYITPDNHYMKSYFNKMLDNNLSYYQTTFLAPNANPMGAMMVLAMALSSTTGMHLGRMTSSLGAWAT